MNDAVDSQNNESVWKSLLWCLPMLAVTLLLLSRGRIPSGGASLCAFAAVFLLFNSVFFQVIHTRKTYRLRAVVFVTYALCFVVSFIANLIEERGTMALSEANLMEGLTPFCHIVIPMTIIPAALTKTIIFPGTIVGASHSIAGMFALWIGSSLSLGRGFCGWFCFFGGMDEGFSRIGKKPILKNIDKKWTYLPYAVLLLVVIGAAVTLAPVYCDWLCPFKTVTEFAEIVSVKTLIQAVIFVSLFLALVVVLPVLTKRRTQCSLFCPFGAFQSFTNKLNAFEVRVDPEKCVQCGRCIKECPTFSLDAEAVARGKTALTCVKCGKCVDTCPKKAPYFYIKGTPLTDNSDTKRRLFLYPAFIILFTMAGGFTQDAIVRVIRLVTTGSMI